MDIDQICYGCMKEKLNAEGGCPHCGYVNSIARDNSYLKEGTLIGNRYIIGRLLGHGGFGITYLGYDKTLEVVVAIKEYLPGEMATRTLGETSITIYTGEKKQQFDYGLKQFLEEARVLAR